MREEIVGAVLPWVVQCYLWHAFTHQDIAIDVVLFWPTFQLAAEGWGPSTEFRRQLCSFNRLLWAVEDDMEAFSFRGPPERCTPSV